MRKPPADRTVQTCKAHCSGCHSHFSSDGAFDAHRKGSFQQGTRYCEEPEDTTHETKDGKRFLSLEVAQPNGRCEIAGGEPKYGVTIWRKAQDPKPVISPAPVVREAA